MDPSAISVTQNACFSLLTHNKQLLLATFCDTTAGIGVFGHTEWQTNKQTDGQTDVEIEIVI